MLAERRSYMSDLDLDIELSPTHVGISPPPTLQACLESLMDNLILRTCQANRACAATLDASLVENESPCLRLILSDDLPGLGPDEYDLYAFLSEPTQPPASFSPQARSLAALAVTMDHLVQYFDLYSAGTGSTLWVDIPHREAPALDCKVIGGSASWFHRPLYKGNDLLKRLSGDQEIADRVLAVFLATTPDLIDQLNHTLAAGDWDEARRLYHSIKGSAANVGGTMLCEVAWAGERSAQANDLETALAILPRLNWEFDRLNRHCRR